MHHPLQRIPARRKLPLLLLLLVLTGSLMVVLSWTLWGERYSIVHLELAGNEEKARQVIAAWDASGSRDSAVLNVLLDFPFLVVYSTTIGLACVMAANVFQSRARWWVSVGVTLAWGQWLAALLDVSENVALLKMLRGSAVVEPWPQIAQWSAVSKFILVGTGLLYAVIGACVELDIVGRRKRRLLLLSVIGALAAFLLVLGQSGSIAYLLVIVLILAVPLEIALGGWAADIYFLRVPIIIAIGILGFWGAAFYWPSARLLLGNAFDIGTPQGIVLVSWTAFLCAWVVMVTWRLVRIYGSERFHDAPPLPADPNDVGWRDLAYYALILIALPVVGGTIWTSTALPWWCEALYALAGFVFSLICLGTLLVFGEPPGNVAGGRSFLPGAGFVPSVRDLDLLEKPRNRARQIARPLYRLIPQPLGRGYLRYENGTAVRMLPGHVAAIALLVVTLAAYYGVGRYGSYLKIRDGDPPSVPTLCYLLLLAMLLCWGLSALAFLLDRYRIPVLIPLLAVLFATSYWPPTTADYFFDTEEHTKPAQGDASSEDSIVVVAANGGGIQSAAWTARVLTGLEEECRVRCKRSFAGSIRMISSVSGGSVGTMYFVNEYTDDGGPPPAEVLEDIVDRAKSSSLDYIAWGLLYPDLRRTVWPYESEWDRGRALEAAWLQQDPKAQDSKGGRGVGELLYDWGDDQRHPGRPDVIFNATVAETGSPLALTTTDLPEGMLTQDKLFSDGGNDGQVTDVSVVTATRLSAAYPYVSPAARADVGGKAAYHVVDGGYYDNYGISSLVSWLDHKLKEDDSIERVLIVQILGAPSDVQPTSAESAQDLKEKRGWFYQAFAPASTVLNVRGAGQSAHNEVELDLLRDKWCGKDLRPAGGREQCVNDERHVDIETAVFEFDGADSPLSWHLTEAQKGVIGEQWRAELSRNSNTREGWCKVQHFLGTKEVNDEEGSSACEP